MYLVTNIVTIASMVQSRALLNQICVWDCVCVYLILLVHFFSGTNTSDDLLAYVPPIYLSNSVAER